MGLQVTINYISDNIKLCIIHKKLMFGNDIFSSTTIIYLREQRNKNASWCKYKLGWVLVKVKYLAH